MGPALREFWHKEYILFVSNRIYGPKRAAAVSEPQEGGAPAPWVGQEQGSAVSLGGALWLSVPRSAGAWQTGMGPEVMKKLLEPCLTLYLVVWKVLDKGQRWLLSSPSVGQRTATTLCRARLKGQGQSVPRGPGHRVQTSSGPALASPVGGGLLPSGGQIGN